MQRPINCYCNQKPNSAICSVWPTNVHAQRSRGCFYGQRFKEYLVKRGIAASRSTPYHRTGNSQVQPTNKTIWKTVQLMVCDQQIPVEKWLDVLPDALHAVRSLLCTSTNSTPHERFFGFERRSVLGKSLSSWLQQKGPVLLRQFVRNKDESLVDEVDLLDANPSFAHIRFPDGRESTVSTTDLAPCPRTTASEPSSELTNNLSATGTTAEAENAQKPLEQTDKHDLESTTQLDNERLQNDSANISNSGIRRTRRIRKQLERCGNPISY